MTFRPEFYNSLSAKKEVIEPIESGHVKMYVCGPTVYDRPHLGNARSVVIYDLIYRLFKVLFDKVTYVRNITDVDDKINEAAKKKGITINELTKKVTDDFYDDIGALNVLRPTVEPKATEHIGEMIAIIEQLIGNGNAYESEGHVLFDVESYDDYGVLSNRNLEEMIAGARVEVASYKKNPLDFVLWKPSDEEDDISSIFESPWGKGRPGWHIECSAMSSKYLGVDFDIHGGGADLQFPHHENEIAQSRCAAKGSNFAKYWIHNGFLTVNGEKMSKSLGNFVSVYDLLEKGVPGSVIRYFLLSSHYRKPIDFNDKAIDDAKKALEKFYSVIDLESINESALDISLYKDRKEFNEIISYLSDDLNIAKVTAKLHQMSKSLKSKDDQGQKYQFAAILDFLGLLDRDFGQSQKSFDISDEEIEKIIAQRLKAKQEKDYQLSDKLRDKLLSKGVVLEDVAGGRTIWKKL